MNPIAAVLAQASTSAATAASAEPGADLASRVEALKVQLQDLLGTLDLWHVLLIAAIGLVSLTYGWRFYYVLAILLCGSIGFLAGDALAQATHGQVTESGWYPIVMRVVGAMAFGAVAIPYLRLGIFVIAGVAGGYAGYVASLYLAPGMSLLFAAIGFVAVGLVSMAFFQLVIVVGTAALGSVSLVLAATWLLHGYHHDSYVWLLQREGLLPLAALVGTFVGTAIQLQLVPDGGVRAHYQARRQPADEEQPATAAATQTEAEPAPHEPRR